MLERGEGEDPIVSGATRAGDFAIENGRRRFEGRAAMVTRRTSVSGAASEQVVPEVPACHRFPLRGSRRSEEHTSELQSLMRISYAVFCLKKKKTRRKQIITSRK